MRVLGGKYKGRSIQTGSSLFIRPLTNKLKESIFDTLGDFFLGKEVLDLFAGSGSFGIEAYSRGAATVTFVENSRQALVFLNKNLDNIGIPPACFQICKGDAIKFCQTESRSYDLIFTDPPFNFNSLQTLIDTIMHKTLLNKNGLVILHHEISNPIALKGHSYELFKQKRFGRNITSYLIHEVNNA